LVAWLCLATADAQVLFLNRESLHLAPATLTGSTPIAGLRVTVTVARLIPAKGARSKAQQPFPTLAELSRLASSAEVLAALRGPEKKPFGKVTVLHYATRDLLLAPAGDADFSVLEGRPSFFTGAELAQGLSNRLYGLDLRVTAALLAPSPPSGPPTPPAPANVRLQWKGRLIWSRDILAQWEKLAVTAFNWASKIPGATYQSQTLDDDGFAGPSGGLDLGGLFGKKKKKGAEEPAKTGVAIEPSYLMDAGRTELSLEGDELLPDGRAAVFELSRAKGEDPETIYLILYPKLD